MVLRVEMRLQEGWKSERRPDFRRGRQQRGGGSGVRTPPVTPATVTVTVRGTPCRIIKLPIIVPATPPPPRPLPPF